jgi:hypothetical protein
VSEGRQKVTFWEAVIFFIVFSAIAAGAALVHAKIVYGDTRCAFADCRIIIEQKK